MTKIVLEVNYNTRNSNLKGTLSSTSIFIQIKATTNYGLMGLLFNLSNLANSIYWWSAVKTSLNQKNSLSDDLINQESSVLQVVPRLLYTPST